jgi:hypothetical protein
MKEEQDQIVNKVAGSALVTFDLEEYFQPGERVLLDIKGRLYDGLLLREKDFREFIRQEEWSRYQDKYVAIHCSADAIIPTWAYMLLAIALEPYARRVVFGTLEDLETELFRTRLREVDWSSFANAKVVVKGCSKVVVPVAVYVDATSYLKPFAASLMFGEPCSTVPLFKRGKSQRLMPGGLES